MATTVDTMKGPAAGTLSAGQWQALGRLADRYQRVEEAGEFISREFGGTLTAHTLALAELVQDPNFIRNLREIVQTLKLLAETGLLEQLREYLSFAAESRDYLDLDQVVGGLIRSLEHVPLAQIATAWKAETEGEAPARKPSAGGWSGLVRLLRDPQVQGGLAELSLFFQRLRYGSTRE